MIMTSHKIQEEDKKHGLKVKSAQVETSNKDQAEVLANKTDGIINGQMTSIMMITINGMTTITGMTIIGMTTTRNQVSELEICYSLSSMPFSQLIFCWLLLMKLNCWTELQREFIRSQDLK